MRRIASIIAAFFLASPIFALLVSSERYGYSLDLPEGAEIADMTEDESSVLFTNKYFNLQTLVRVWEKSRFPTALDAMKATMTRLEADADCSQTTWRRQEGVIATFTSPLLLPDTMAGGWAVTVALPMDKGYATFLCYTTKELFDAEDLLDVIISVLDSILIDDGSFKEPGIITSTSFPREKPKQVSLKIGKKTVRTQIDEIDQEANQYVIDREFAVFSVYAANNYPEVFDAWTRFYRIVGKDAILRLKKASFDIYSALQGEAAKQDKDNPEAAIAQMLLNWTQDFEYSRPSDIPTKADLTNIPGVLLGEGSDCDGRSLLLAVLYKNIGLDACMFVSPAYSHALVGVYLEGKLGQTIEVDGRGFLVGDTTVKGLTFGKMAADQQDRSKWLTVEVY